MPSLRDWLTRKQRETRRGRAELRLAERAALWGGRPVGVPSALRGGRFVLDRAALESSRTPQSRVLMLNTPWNPVGTALSRPELHEVMAFAAAHGLELAPHTPELLKLSEALNAARGPIDIRGFLVGD